MDKVYVNGVDNYFFRGLMKRAGIKSACFSYLYSTRTPGIRWDEELDFLDSFIVDHGFSFDLEDTDVIFDMAEGYINFLNRYGEHIDFAFDIPQLGFYVRDNTDVPTVPFFSKDIFNTLFDEDIVALTTADLERPFFGNYYRRLRKEVKFHGYSLTSLDTSFNVSTINTSAWMMGKYGYTYYWDGKTLQKYYKKKKSYRSIVARSLIKQGYPLNYNSILKDDLEEVHLMNLLAWKQFGDSNA